MDEQLAAIHASINLLTSRIDERYLRNDERASQADECMTRLEAAMTATQSQIQNLKTTMIVTAISTATATVLGVAAFNAAILSNMVASFESGKDIATAQAEIRRQSEETATLIKDLKRRLEQPPDKKSY